MGKYEKRMFLSKMSQKSADSAFCQTFETFVLVLLLFKGTLTTIISPRGTDQQQSSVSKRMRTCLSITSKFSASTTFARSTCSNGTIRRMELRAAFSKSLKSLLIFNPFELQTIRLAFHFVFYGRTPNCPMGAHSSSIRIHFYRRKTIIFFHQLVTIQNFWMRLRNRLRKFCTYLLFVFTATICFKRGEDYQLLTSAKPTNNTKQSG